MNSYQGFRISTYNVYFIRHGDPAKPDNPIKIGKVGSNSIRGRFISMQTSNPYKLEILFIAPADSRYSEGKVHRMFKKHRILGEWFEPHEDIVKFIKFMKEDRDKTGYMESIDFYIHHFRSN
jgi:hypothetical protein